jgi:phosphatidyl-myo-inositol dimannoside synthase
MRICHVTPHLPPDQAANALLPVHLGRWTRDRGGEVSYVSHPPRAAAAAADALPGTVVWVPRHEARGIARRLRISGAAAAVRVGRLAAPEIERADLVHVHSNGLLAEVAAAVARRRGKPVVLTLYGTEIWHYRRRRLLPDLFTRAYMHARFVTFYSRRLRDRAFELGLSRDRAEVCYPPVAEGFTFHDERGRAEARGGLALDCEDLLVNVKRLHPLAGQRFLVEAMARVVRARPRARLVFCGEGPSRADLEALAGSLGLSRAVTFAGLVDNAEVARYDAAADVFVLPSVLEALPTVAVEALASGTPVISSDNPGGVELHALFGDDLHVVPRENSSALANAIVEFLSHKHRTSPTTAAALEREFSPARVAARFESIYEQAIRTTG